MKKEKIFLEKGKFLGGEGKERSMQKSSEYARKKGISCFLSGTGHLSRAEKSFRSMQFDDYNVGRGAETYRHA